MNSFFGARLFSFILAFILVASQVVIAGDGTSQGEQKDEQKIEFLLNEVENSGIVFIRNGDEHPAKKARQHLEYKYKMAKKRFLFFGPSRAITVSEFIEKIASQSSTSGKDYHVKLKSGEVITTKKWLLEKLKEFKPSSNSQ